MQAVKVKATYLQRILKDSARAFMYRTRVRRLLGLPETTGKNMYFSPILPPIGFRYAVSSSGRNKSSWNPVLENRSPIQNYLSSHQTSNFPEGREEKGNCRVGKSEALPTNAHYTQSSPKKDQVLIKGSKTEYSIKKQAEVKGKSIDVSEMQTSSTVYGMTPQHNRSQRKEFSVLEKKQKKIVTKADEKENLQKTQINEKTPNVGKSKALPINTHDNSVPKKDQCLINNDFKDDFPALQQAEVKEEVKEISKMQIAIPGITSHKTRFPALDTKKKEKNPGTDEKENLQKPQKNQDKTTQKPEINPAKTMLSVSAQKSKPVDSGSSDTESLFYSSPEYKDPNAAKQIKQLHQTVQELSSKLASRPADLQKKENQSQSSANQDKPVMIINHPVSPVRKSHAFWERNYLGRFHMRTLR